MSNNDLKTLHRYRKKIKAVDAEIFRLLRSRVKLAQKIMKFKNQKKMPLRDTKREAEILNQLIKTLAANTTKPKAKKFLQALLGINIKYLVKSNT